MKNLAENDRQLFKPKIKKKLVDFDGTQIFAYYVVIPHRRFGIWYRAVSSYTTNSILGITIEVLKIYFWA